MTQEQQQVVEMLAEGRISQDEALRLYAALDLDPDAYQSSDAQERLRRRLQEVAGSAPPAEHAAASDAPSAQPQHVRIRVSSHGGDRVTIRLPIGLATQLARWIPGRRVWVNGSPMPVEELLRELNTARVGQIVEVDSEQGDRVVITLE